MQLFVLQYYQEKSETYAIISKSFFPTTNFFSFKKFTLFTLCREAKKKRHAVKRAA